MAAFRNIGGTWRNVTAWRNISGTWKTCVLWRNIGGTWKVIGALFTPDGGSVSASAIGTASATVTCSQPAVWTYTGGGSGGTVDVASGGTASSITFTVVAPGIPDVTRTWSLTGVSNGVTRNFSVSVTAFGSNPGT